MAASTYPAWVFDGSPIPDPLGHGARAVEFLRRLKHPASSAPGRAFQLFDWQERIVRRIYGPRHPDGSRVVRKVFLLIPRGNRKTSLAGALSLLHLLGPERRPGGQVILAARDREQAGIAFNEAVGIIRQDRRLLDAVSIHDAFNAARRIKAKATSSTLRPIPADGKGAHGTTPTLVIADELHAWGATGRDLWDALGSGMVKVADTLMIVATTAGRGAEGLAAEEFDLARRVALGEVDNPAILPVLFALEPGDDWRDEAVWHKTNPGLAHGFPTLEGLRDKAREAEQQPSARAAFRQFHVNEWLALSTDPLFDLETFDGLAQELEEADLAELPAYVGVDLSINGDLSAVVIAWRHPDGRVTIRPQLFVPGEELAERAARDEAPYEAWADAGHVTICPGPIIDFAQVADAIRELCATYDVQEIAFDPHLARVMMQELHDEGLPVVELRQAPLTMGPAHGHVERLVTGQLLRHDGNPALRAHFAGAVASRNSTGLIRLHRARKHVRIDGAVATAMAVARAVAGETTASAYNSPDVDGLTFI